MFLRFLAIPILSILLLFLKDNKKDRKRTMNVLLIVNTLLFLFPITIAFLNPAEKAGGGAVWLFLIILPLSTIAFFVLLTLKIIFHNKSK